MKVMNSIDRTRIGALFLTVYLVSAIACPCRGVAILASVALEEVGASCCDHCRKSSQKSEKPDPEPQNCVCSTGCCALFIVPDNSLEGEGGCCLEDWPVTSEWLSSVLPISVDSASGGPLSLQNESPPGGTLLPDLSSLLI
jgi:hypothetical protein